MTHNNELDILIAGNEQEARDIFFEWLSIRFFNKTSTQLSPKQRKCIDDLSVDFGDAVIQAFHTQTQVVPQVIARIDQYYREFLSCN